MIVMIDNYDSFVYNLYQLIGTYHEICVVRNDEITIQELEEMHPDAIVISPGPGKPEDAGISEEVIRYFYDKCPILGICLGHQAMIEVFGGTVGYAKTVMHGKQSLISIKDVPIFKGLESHITVGRYHSLAGHHIPDCLTVIGESDDHEVMAIKHNDYPVYGLQFHPESILTPDGDRMIKNFIKEITND